MQRQLTLDEVVAAFRTDRSGPVGGLGVIVDVEEVGRAQVRVALVIASVYRGHVDGGRYRRGAVFGDGDLAAEVGK
ncbi:Uncharacterised protein [Mycobacteroides abscessus subsp. abscessus]|nr:Uncharacterised protein [Mycobacteroides abscessus subsp. abscessus]